MIINALTFHLYYMCYHASIYTSLTYRKQCITCEWVLSNFKKCSGQNSTDTHNIQTTQDVEVVVGEALTRT